MTIVHLTPEPLALSSLLFPEVVFGRWVGQKTEVTELRASGRECGSADLKLLQGSGAGEVSE